MDPPRSWVEEIQREEGIMPRARCRIATAAEAVVVAIAAVVHRQFVKQVVVVVV